MRKLLVVISAIILIGACSENYSKGEQIGYVTKFSRDGLMFKTWEGHLNTTQTGNNSSTGFDFSIDGFAEDSAVIKQLDSALTYGWKVKLTYHTVKGMNCFGTRGDQNDFITEVKIIERGVEKLNYENISVEDNEEDALLPPSIIFTDGDEAPRRIVLIHPDHTDTLYIVKQLKQ